MFSFKNSRTYCLVICWLPALWLVIDILLDNLGSNPIQAIHIRLGDWALRFLCITLLITPIQTITNWRGMSDFRRMFGLFTFVYASLHLLAYLIVDHYFAWRMIAVDIWESTYIWFGLIAYVIIFLLAITTPKWSQRYMGKMWKKLHRYIYLASALAVIHFFWQLKGNLAEPVLYAVIVALLLIFRLLVSVKNRKITRLMIPKGRS